jgi:hypothetical protein
MTVQPATPPDPAPETLLFAPGPRLGWTFTDRRARITPYTEPQPDPRQITATVATRQAKAQRAYRFAIWWVMRPFLPLALVLYALSVFVHDANHHAHTGGLAAIAAVLAVTGIAYPAWCYTRVALARDADPQRIYQAQAGQWQQRAWQHEQAELARLAAVPEWEPVTAPARRVDVYGGTLAGWQALLAVFGTSVLAERPLLVADFSGQLASGQLTTLARHTDATSVMHLLPSGLDSSGILAGLTPPQLASALAEAIHAGSPGGARADRAIDTRVTEQLTGALNQAVTPIRLAAAVQAALGQPVPAGVLTAEETAWIGGGLFQDTYRAQVASSLVRLEAFITDLARHTGTGTPRPARPAWYTCLALEPGAHGARTELLTALTVQWLTARVTASTATAPAVIIAGADALSGAHLETLASACERRGVPLTLLFRHLRDDATALVGQAAMTGFMRLGNHHEAEQAASFIGRDYQFVLSGWTVTHGGEQGSTATTGHSHGTSQTRGFTSNHGWTSEDLFRRSSSGGQTRSRDFGRSEEWSQSDAYSEAVNWSRTQNTGRVYQFTIEPTVLQNLPDYALLLSSGPHVRAVECDPAIVAMTTPHAALPDGPNPPHQAISGDHNDGAYSHWPGEQPAEEVPAWRPGGQPQ